MANSTAWGHVCSSEPSNGCTPLRTASTRAVALVAFLTSAMFSDSPFAGARASVGEGVGEGVGKRGARVGAACHESPPRAAAKVSDAHSSARMF